VKFRTLPHGAIREIEPGDATTLERISALHVELLSFGPVAGLGVRVTEAVAYRMPLVEGLLRVAVYESDGQLGGFISFTSDSQSLLGKLLRSRGWAVVGRIAWSVVQSPVRILRIPGILRAAIARTPPVPDALGRLAEVTSLAVRPEFADVHFVRAHRLRVAEELLRYAMDALGAEGATHVRGIIDADNRAVQILYGRFGAEFRNFRQGGRPMVEVLLALK